MDSDSTTVSSSESNDESTPSANRSVDVVPTTTKRTIALASPVQALTSLGSAVEDVEAALSPHLDSPISSHISHRTRSKLDATSPSAAAASIPKADLLSKSGKTHIDFPNLPPPILILVSF